MAAGELLEADVAERVDESAEVALASLGGIPDRSAAEAQLVPDDVVAGIRDRVADDRHLLALGRGLRNGLTQWWSAIARK